MTILLLMLLAASSDPCKQDTSGWKTVRHGGEEIRHHREEQTVLLAVRNRGDRPTQVDIVWHELELEGTIRVFDITANKDEGKVRGGFAVKLQPGSCNSYRLDVD